MRRPGLCFLVAGLGLVGASFGLFGFYVNAFSEGTGDATWGQIVLDAAWFSLVAAAVVGLAGLISIIRESA